MPKAKSLKQWRFMKLISEGKYEADKAPERGGPPKQIADKYAKEGFPGSGTPNYANGKGPSKGGSWTHAGAAGWHKKQAQKERDEGNYEEAAQHKKDARAHDKAHEANEKKKKKLHDKNRERARKLAAEGKYKESAKAHKKAREHKKHGHFVAGDSEYAPKHQHLQHLKAMQAGRKGKKHYTPRSAPHRFKGGKFKKSADEAFYEFYKGAGAGVIVVDKDGKILIGKQNNGFWSTPGGHVDPGETHEDAALRELNEETGLNAKSLAGPIHEDKLEGNDSKTFVVNNFSGKLKDSDELRNLQFVHVHALPDNIRPCSAEGIKAYLGTMQKSLSVMLAMEKLEKNILRGPDGRSAVYEMTHADSLKLVGGGIFKMLKNITRDMKDEDFKKVNIGEYVFHLRKHMNDVYSGRVEDGHKLIHQFANRSLPQIAADLMSLFEWYAPEDEDIFNYIKDDIEDEAVHGGIQKLMDNYKRHNIGEIYDEMDNIREEIRRGVATDLQQVESRMMSLFDRLDKVTAEMSEKQSGFGQKIDKDVETIEKKLAELQSKLDELNSPKKSEVMAVSSEATPAKSNKILDEYYSYLPKPEIHISPDGKIKISFGDKWNLMEKENFLNDLKAKVIKKKDD